jgi:hypothetical protein
MTPATMIAFDGMEQPVTEWALDYGIAPAVIIARLERGLPVEEAITKPMVAARGQKLTGEHIDNYVASQRRVWWRDRRKARRAASSPSANARRHTYNNETLTARQWSERTGIPADIIAGRLRKGWPVERALTEPASSRLGTVRCNSRLYTFDGKTMTLTQWANELGIRPPTLLRRLKKWPIEEAFTLPVDERKGRRRAGVGRNSVESQGTGGHPFAQESAKLEISE